MRQFFGIVQMSVNIHHFLSLVTFSYCPGQTFKYLRQWLKSASFPVYTDNEFDEVIAYFSRLMTKPKK